MRILSYPRNTPYHASSNTHTYTLSLSSSHIFWHLCHTHTPLWHPINTHIVTLQVWIGMGDRPHHNAIEDAAISMSLFNSYRMVQVSALTLLLQTLQPDNLALLQPYKFTSLHPLTTLLTLSLSPLLNHALAPSQSLIHALTLSYSHILIHVLNYTFTNTRTFDSPPYLCSPIH